MTVPPLPSPLVQKLCEKVLRFVDYMAEKLRSSGYYLEEREKEDMTLQFVSDKVGQGLYCVWLHYGMIHLFRYTQ